LIESSEKPVRVLLLLLVIVLGAAEPRAAELPNLAKLQTQGLEISALVVDLDRRQALGELAPDQALIPASVTKLYTAALAIRTWGPAKRFKTELLRRGAIADGVLTGDLVLLGGGDPTLTDADLWRLARDARRAGVTRVIGDLEVNVSLFGRQACVTDDRCKAERQSGNSYDAPVSALSVNFNNAVLAVAPGQKAGDLAVVEPDPLPQGNLAVEGSVKSDDRRDRLVVGRKTEDGTNVLVVRGSVKAGRPPQRVYRSIAHPAEHAGEMFQALLAQAGVVVEGGVRVVAIPPEEAVETLAEVRGEALSEVLTRMLYYSNNVIADTLTLGLFKALKPKQEVSLPAAGGLLLEEARRIARDSPFAAPAGSQARLFDGSGLNPDNRLSARDLVTLLDAVYLDFETFPAMAGALVVPRHATSRTLRLKNKAWLDRLAVKTGGLSRPLVVNSLAGYFRFSDGGWGAFALIANAPRGKSLPRVEIYDALRRDLAVLWNR
jgi:D-alanyl-D-alanine carboxypeptidase/D-alanyl-D-alanine-endopeptidase (penicillin-binding protein 4)